jgi:hypothetical protein
MSEYSSNNSTPRPSFEEPFRTMETRAVLHPEGPPEPTMPENTETPPSTKEENPRDLMMEQLMALVKAVLQQKALPQIQEKGPFENKRLEFKGEDVSDFLDSIEERAEYYQWSTAQRIKNVIAFSDRTRKDVIVQSMPEFKEAQTLNDWDETRRVMRQRFRDQDTAQKEETDEALRAWLAACSSMNKLSLQSYLDAFGPRFARCERAGTVQEQQKGYYLVKGLNKARLNRVVGKFKLKANNLASFDYQKIQGYLNDYAQQEMEVENLNPTLRNKEPSAPNSITVNTETPKPYMFPPGSLKMPETRTHYQNAQNERPKGQRGVQMPPNSAITQAEVDDLVDRVKGLQINEITLQSWNHREQEIFRAIPSIMDEAYKPPNAAASSNRAYPVKSQVGPNFAMNAMNANGIADRILGCLGCGDEGHRVAECAERAQLTQQGWIYYDNQTRRVRWGSGHDNDAGAISGIGPPGRQNSVIIRHIQDTLRGRDMPVTDPRVTPCPFRAAKAPEGPTATTASLMGVISPFEEDGVLSIEDFNNKLRRSMAVEEATRIPEPMRVNSMAAEPFGHCDAAAFRSQGPAFPTVRNNHNRDSDHFNTRRAPFQDGSMDVDFQHVPKDPRPKSKADPSTKKVKWLDTLEGKPEDVVRTLLQTVVQLPLGVALANMPDVKRTFTKAGYTKDEAEQLLDLNAVEVMMGQAKHCTREPEGPSGPVLHCNAVLAAIPDYMEVEARDGVVTRCVVPPQGEKQTLSTAHIGAVRQDLNHERGFERLRRDCPKAWVQIHGARLEALLDSGAELNTIRWKTALAAGLSVTSLPREMENAQLRTANGGRESFEGIVWRVPIQIGSVEVRTNLFVVRSLAHPLILGNPFMAEGRASFEYNEDGNMYCKLWSTDKTYSTRFRAAEEGTRGGFQAYSARVQAGNGRGE